MALIVKLKKFIYKVENDENKKRERERKKKERKKEKANINKSIDLLI